MESSLSGVPFAIERSHAHLSVQVLPAVSHHFVCSCYTWLLMTSAYLAQCPVRSLLGRSSPRWRCFSGHGPSIFCNVRGRLSELASFFCNIFFIWLPLNFCFYFFCLGKFFVLQRQCGASTKRSSPYLHIKKTHALKKHTHKEKPLSRCFLLRCILYERPRIAIAACPTKCCNRDED